MSVTVYVSVSVSVSVYVSSNVSLCARVHVSCSFLAICVFHEPEVAQQLAVYGENLKEKTSQMRRMAKELQSYHTQVKDLQDEVDRYNKDFQGVKQGYFRTLREQRQGLASTV